jgi:predicted ester cyclase
MRQLKEAIMTVEANKALLRRFQEHCNAGASDAAMELLDPEVVDHDLPPGLPPGRAGVKQFFAILRTAFPDFRITIEDEVREVDRVAVRVTVRGTHRGTFMGVPPTGRRVSFEDLEIVRVAQAAARALGPDRRRRTHAANGRGGGGHRRRPSLAGGRLGKPDAARD